MGATYHYPEKNLQHPHLLLLFQQQIYLFGLIFSTHASQYEESVFKQFCNPILDLDRIIKSSAYNNEFNLVPSGRTNGSDSVFSNKYGKFFYIEQIKICTY